MKTFGIALALSAVVACGGATTSSTSTSSAQDGGAGINPPPSPGPNPTPGPGPAPGPSVLTLASLDDACDGNAALTGRAIVAALKAEYDATYTPIGGGASAPLVLKVSYTDGAITCHPAVHQAPGIGAPDVLAWLELTAAIELTTGDGTFAEKLPAQIARRYGNALELSTRMPVESVKGTFTPAIMSGFDKLSIGIFGNLQPAGTTDGDVQQYGEISKPPPPGQVNPGTTTGVGAWK
jgi:hypothetical protein